MRVPRTDAVTARPDGVVAAEDADAREAPEQLGRPPVGVREERALARPRHERALRRVIPEASASRDAGRVREDGQERRDVEVRRGGDRLDPEGHPDVDLAECGSDALCRPDRRQQVRIRRRDERAGESGARAPARPGLGR